MPTNFNYNRNIPFSTNNPSVDQPNMLTNTNSIDSIIAVDHLTFNTATGVESDGYHKVIHFIRQGGDPVAIGTIGQVYTKQITVGINSDEALFFESGVGRITQLTGIVAGAGSQSSIGTSGYTPLTGGLIMQWGTFTKSSGNQTITFPTPFPTTALNVQVTGLDLSTQLAFYAFWANTFAAANFHFKSNGLVNGTTFQYVAIGN